MEKRVCSRCKIEKSIDKFNKCSNHKIGYSYHCKECDKIRRKIYLEKNREKINKHKREYYKNNTDHVRILAKKSTERNKENVKKRGLDYYEKNKTRLRKEALGRYHRNKKRLRKLNKIYCKNNRDRINERRKESEKKIRSTLSFRLNNSIRGAIYRSLKGKKNGRHWEVLVHYTQKDLRKHLESQFKPGMNWNNYGEGGWQLDHRIPVSLFNITGIKSKGFKECWKLENLQPM